MTERGKEETEGGDAWLGVVMIIHVYNYAGETEQELHFTFMYLHTFEHRCKCLGSTMSIGHLCWP